MKYMYIREKEGERDPESEQKIETHRRTPVEWLVVIYYIFICDSRVLACVFFTTFFYAIVTRHLH